MCGAFLRCQEHGVWPRAASTRLLLAAVVLLFASASTVFAQTTWMGLGDGIRWHDQSNWDTNFVPGPNDAVYINNGDTVLIDEDAVCASLHIGTNTGQSGTLRVRAPLVVADNGGGDSYIGEYGTGTLIIEQEGWVAIHSDVFVAPEDGSQGTITVSGGGSGGEASDFATLWVDYWLYLGGTWDWVYEVPVAGGTATLTINNSNVNVDNAANMNHYGYLLLCKNDTAVTVNQGVLFAGTLMGAAGSRIQLSDPSSELILGSNAHPANTGEFWGG